MRDEVEEAKEALARVPSASSVDPEMTLERISKVAALVKEAHGQAPVVIEAPQLAPTPSRAPPVALGYS